MSFSLISTSSLNEGRLSSIKSSSTKSLMRHFQQHLNKWQKKLAHSLKWISEILVYLYKAHISAHLWSSCRFEPTCSQYAKDCLHEHKFGTALLLISKRLCKCHPFGPRGFDPAPKNLQKISGGLH